MILGEYGCPSNNLIIKVLKIKVLKMRGACPAYRVRDRIVTDRGYKPNLEETGSVCAHSFGPIAPCFMQPCLKDHILGLHVEGDILASMAKGACIISVLIRVPPYVGNA